MRTLGLSDEVMEMIFYWHVFASDVEEEGVLDVVEVRSPRIQSAARGGGVPGVLNRPGGIARARTDAAIGN